MGVLDIVHEIEHSQHWVARNRKIKLLRFKRPNPTGSSSSNSDTTGSASTSNSEQKKEFVDLELYRAAKKKDVDNFIDTLSKVVDEKDVSLNSVFESVTPVGNTLLHVSANFGNEKIVRLTAYHHPQILTRANSKGETALHLAAKSGHGLTVSTLIRLQDEFMKFQKFHPDNIQLLTKFQNNEGNTALHEALINVNPRTGNANASPDEWGLTGNHFWVAKALFESDLEASFLLNKNGESCLYLAAKLGYHETYWFKSRLSRFSEMISEEAMKGKSPLLASVSYASTATRKKGKKDVLEELLKEEPKFLNTRDGEGRTLLHCASSIGYLNGVKYLLSNYASAALQRDNNGSFPIHLAAINGHIDVVKELLQYCPDLTEMLDGNDENILHLAAKAGRVNMVKYILGSLEMEKLINQKDINGNSALHLASVNWHPSVVSVLTWDSRVDLRLTNDEGFTALDAAEFHMQMMPPFRERLTWTALKSAGVEKTIPGKSPKQESENETRINIDKYKSRVDTLLLVSILITTVTFAAGFTIPGGNNPSEKPDRTGSELRNAKFYVFIFCNTFAMYGSLIVAITLIWAQLGDIRLVLNALRVALPLLGFSLVMMSSAFTAGVCLVVSKLNWLADAVLVICLVLTLVLALLFFPICSVSVSSNRLLRSVSYYPFYVLLLVTGSYRTD